MFRQHLPITRAAVLLAASLTLFADRAQAELIGVGLDWRSGIFVQEYWHKQEPHYLIANLSKDDVEITVHEFDSKWRLGQPLPKPVTDAWKVHAGKHLTVDAKPLAGPGLYRFVIGGKQPLGVLSGPKDPGYEGKEFSTALGLNGSGGSMPCLYVVQPKLELAAGSTAKIVLQLPSKSGVLKFKGEPNANADPLRPVELVVESATSETLPVTKDDKHNIVIDTNAPKKDAPTHEVVLQVTLPKAKSAQLFMIDGWLANANGGGSGVTRGLLVVP